MNSGNPTHQEATSGFNNPSNTSYPTHQEATSGFSNPSNTSYPTQLPGDSSQGLGSNFDSSNVNPSSTVQPLGNPSHGQTDPLGDPSKGHYTAPLHTDPALHDPSTGNPSSTVQPLGQGQTDPLGDHSKGQYTDPLHTDPALHDPLTGNVPQSHTDRLPHDPTDLNRGNDSNFYQGSTGPSMVAPTSISAPQYPSVPPKDTSPSTSTATTHGSVYESNTPTQAAHTNPLDTSDRTSNEPSTIRGVKNTVAGSIKKLAGVVSGNEERKLAGEVKKQEGKEELNAAKEKKADKDNSYGRGDLEGAHVHDDDMIKTAGANTADINPSHQTYGRGGLGGAEVGEDPVFAKANTGKGVMGTGRGDLEGLGTKEE